MLRVDHLAVVAGRLEAGVALVEDLFGVPMAGGGTHAAMGTHNRLLGLGDLYLEVIATDPGAPVPARPRWFDMDRFSGPPRLANWVVATDDLEGALAAGPAGWGDPMVLSRGDYRWRMAVPLDGRLPLGGACPALIRWDGPLHPAAALPDHGLRLTRLEITHPDQKALRGALAGLDDPRVVLRDGPAIALQAVIDTPDGPRVLA